MAQSPTSPASPCKVAVVNDDQLQRQVLCQILSEGGYQPFPFGSVAEALSSLPNVRPGLIITDLNLPGIDGWHFCRLVRQHPDPLLARIPILTLSATFEGPEAARLSIEMGADAFLPAPVKTERLMQEVRRLAGELHHYVPQKIIILSSDAPSAEGWSHSLSEMHHKATVVAQLDQALSELTRMTPDAVILDLDPLGRTALGQLPNLIAQNPLCGFVTVTSELDPSLAVDAMALGARFHLRKPVDPRYLVSIIERLRQDHALAEVHRLLGEKSKALDDAIRRLRLAVENANVGLWLWHLDTNVVEYSPEWKKQLGYSEQEVTNQFSEWESRLHPEDRDSALAYVRRFLQSGETIYRQEFRLRHKDGSYRRILSQGSFVTGPDGRRSQLIGTHIDLTEIRRLEEERLRFERNLLHTQKLESLGVLAGGIAHDFNNLLMAIMGQLELAQLETDPSTTVGAALKEAFLAVHRASDLTRQLLVYSGKARQEIGPIDINALVSENYRLFRAAIPKQNQFECFLSPSVPRILGDAAQIQQVVMNLITNAAEAITGPGGRIQVRTGFSTFSAEKLLHSCLGNHPPPGSYVWIEIQDNGCGMDEETAKKMFDPFFTTKKTGRGLGMASVLGILRAHHGAILLETGLGRGTTITVLFPGPESSGSTGPKKAGAGLRTSPDGPG